MSRARFLRLLGYAWLALAASLGGRAHDPGLSSTHLVARAGWGELVLQFAPADFVRLAPAVDLDRNGTLSRTEFETGRAAIERVGLTWVIAREGERALKLNSLGAQFEEHESNVVLLLNISEPPLTTWTLAFPRLGELPAQHRHLLTAAAQNRRIVAEQLIAAGDPAAPVNWQATGGREVDGPPEPNPLTSTLANAAIAPAKTASGPALFGSFFLLGVEHIWIGFDHLLFLAGLLLACRRFKSMVAIITSFTVAHSITLVLATFDVVTIPGHLVEPAIAASILYVGIENIVRRDQENRWRWLLTFGFGLIHGFGFAGVLRELGVAEQGRSVAGPLIGFNLGVELGQIAIAAVFLPLLFYVRRFPWFDKRGQVIGSAAVALAGFYWLVERVFF